jgi:cell division septum initiation protein DivIVA
MFPQDEARARDKLSLCAECFAKPSGAAQTEEVDEPLDTLVAEYVALHAEEKRIKGQMDALKERLKKAAEGMPRAGGAVTLRAGDEAVRCSYRTKLKCEDAGVERLAELLAPEEFARLFERKVSFSSHDEEITEFLATENEEHSDARELLRAAVRETETVMLTVVPPRK